MSGSNLLLATGRGATIEILPIHFDVPDHKIPLSTFVGTAEQTKGIVCALNKELFGGQLEFKLYVLPPAEGTFLSRLGIVIGVVSVAAWGFLESDVGQGFIRGLTGHAPSEWAETAGEAVRSFISHTEGEADVARELAGNVLCESARSFLATENRKLERAGITLSQFREAYEAKNAFYENCAGTPHLQAIGFDELPIFPIKREEFPNHQSILPLRDEATDEPWFVSIAQLRVTSPNWDREDSARQWKGRDHQGRDRFFRIEDEEFWSRVALDAIDTHIIDTMKVQWAYQGRPEQPKNCRVLRVLEFNDIVLASPLPDDALLAQLGRIAKVDSEQGDLFSKSS